MFCHFCGKQIPDDSCFCNYCGKNQTNHNDVNTTNKISVEMCFRFYGNFSISSYDKATLNALVEEFKKANPLLSEEYIRISEHYSKFNIYPRIGVFAPSSVKNDAKNIPAIVHRYFHDHGFTTRAVPHVSGSSGNVETDYTYVFEK